MPGGDGTSQDLLASRLDPALLGGPGVMHVGYMDRVAVGVRGEVTPTATSWVLPRRRQLPPRHESVRSGGCRGRATPAATVGQALATA
ncbi:hypothetical protein UB45_02300 [Terrabacter sp. 28]|nr:hypothetical protein UB45_02300 [Terrabacter sp. 28]